MNRMRLGFFIVCSSGFAAAIASWAALNLHQEQEVSQQEGAVSEGDFHAWVHAQLDLKPAQERALSSVEAEFQAKSKALEESLADAGHDLAHAIQDHGRDSPELLAALGKINGLQLELQELTIHHFFDMKEHLDLDQAQKLFEWTHDSISGSH